MDGHTVTRLVLILVAAFILFALITYYNKNKGSAALMSAPPNERFRDQVYFPTKYAASEDEATIQRTTVVPSENPGNEQYRPVDFNYAQGNKTVKDCFPKDRLTLTDLLPKDAANTKWAQVNPAGQGDVRDQNFLTAGFHTGVNTQGQSLRNANLSLRSEPPNPQLKVGPWMQSTIEPDVNRRGFEIGQC